MEMEYWTKENNVTTGTKLAVLTALLLRATFAKDVGGTSLVVTRLVYRCRRISNCRKISGLVLLVDLSSN